MNNIPPLGYWHLGTANSITFATELVEKNKETAKDGTYMIIRKETDRKITWLIFAKENK